MKLRRKVAAIVLIGTMVVCGETRRASAQDARRRDLRMLMNLDLFEPRHNNAQGAPAPAASPADDSMLDQIRTLDAMGYLGNHDDADAGDRRLPELRSGAAPGAEDVAPAKAPPADAVEPAELRRRGAAAMTGRRHIASAFIVAALIAVRICAGNSRLCAIVTAAGRVDAVERRRARARRAASEGMGATSLPISVSACSRTIGDGNRCVPRSGRRCSRTSRRSAICRPKSASECSKDCAGGASFRRRVAMNCSMTMRDGAVCRRISATG